MAVAERDLRIKFTFLPPEAPDHLIVTPSINRWKSNGAPAPLPTMIGSMQRAVGRDGLGDNTWMIISDASNDPEQHALQRNTMPMIDQGDRPARLFFLNPGYQAKVAETVQERTGLPEEVINAVLRGTGYGEHRETLDTLSRALAVASGRPIKVLTVDDDIEIPETKIEWKEDKLPNGLKPKPNSQVLHRFDEDMPPADLFHATQPNSLKPMLDHLGKTVKEIRATIPNLRASATVKDTRSASLHGALRGETAQMELTHDGEDAEGADDAVILASTIGKSKRPDYPTRSIAKAFLEAEFPHQEVPIESYRSGPTEVFAARGSNTIFPDSAVFARVFNEKTALWRWWFVSNLQISLKNPLWTVTGHYRADNDHLPIIFDAILGQSGEQNMYLSTDTEALHSRARLGGNRQDMHEQASSSLVGNMAAVEATKRLELDKTTGLWKINRDGLIGDRAIDKKFGTPNRNFQADHQHANFVFNEMKDLADICERKIAELKGRNHNGDTEAARKTAEALSKYERIRVDIGKKLGGFNFDVFYQHVSDEVRDQVLFYARVVDAVPVVVNEVQKMIREGKYPVIEYVSEPEKTTIYSYTSNGVNGKNGTYHI